MAVRYERRRVEVAYQHIDPLGYLRCHDCTPLERRSELEFVTPDLAKEPCEGCGRAVGEVTVETWATVEVEYTVCKIF